MDQETLMKIIDVRSNKFLSAVVSAGSNRENHVDEKSLFSYSSL